ncbi:MAG: Type II secretion system protein [Microgenomates group bacterium GW2011_GWB1_44_8]|nr:MAG: Type II secretion system protein [Microgenomates group bacterium GW2011_GWB1_44_8]
MRFRYVAKDPSGKTIKGTVDAQDSKSAAGVLRDKKMLTINLVEDKGLLDMGDFSLKFGGVSVSDMANFTRQLSTMITAGLPLTDALSLLRLQSGPKLSPVVSAILLDVQSGVSLSEAMGKHPQAFSKVFVSLVKAGEAAGVVETILNRLADNLEKSREAMIYPVIVLLGMVGVMMVMMVVVVPKLTEVYKQFNADLPVATKTVIAISDFMVNYWFIVIILMGGLVAGGVAYLKTPVGKRWWDDLLYKIPIVGPLSKQVMMTELTRTLALLVGAGVSVVEALNIVADALGNVVIESEIKLIAKRVEKGFPISISFSESGHFPPIAGQMIAVGEETGKLDDVLTKLSSYFESESEQKVKGLTAAIEPLIIILLGIGVGFLIFAIILPIYDITNKSIT